MLKPEKNSGEVLIQSLQVKSRRSIEKVFEDLLKYFL